MPQDPSVAGIEWVPDSQAEPPTGPKLPHAARGLFAVLGCVLVALGAVTLRSHERMQLPVPEPTPVPTPSLDLDSFADPNVQARFETTLTGLPDLTIVLPQFGGGQAVQVQTGDRPSVNTTAFGDLHTLSSDASGRWVAGLSGRTDTNGATLWAAPAGQTPIRIAEGVGGFAWHEADPNRIAFSSGNEILTKDLALDSPSEPAVATPHHLDRWGAWGFVVRPRPNDTSFHVLTPQGGEVATGYQGEVVGALNQRLIVNLTGGRQSPVFVFADTGQAWPVFALTDMQRALSIASGGIDGAVALQVANRDTEAYEIRIFPGNGELVRTLKISEQTGALSWSDDGLTLYYLSRGPDEMAVLYRYGMDTKSLTAAPVGASPTINYWASSILRSVD